MAKNEAKENTGGIEKEFDNADVNTDGFLSKEEIREMLDMHDETKVDALIKTMDTNNDGRVSYAEFASHFKSLMRKD
eukprot:06213.XXX_291093_290812_1 [CDS] Oithona nana genome sequencing.